MASLSTDERVEIILLCGREGWSAQQVADEFSRLHPDREPINKSSVSRLLSKFKDTGSVLDRKRSGRNEADANLVLDDVRNEPIKSLKKSARMLIYQNRQFLKF